MSDATIFPGVAPPDSRHQESDEAFGELSDTGRANRHAKPLSLPELTSHAVDAPPVAPAAWHQSGEKLTNPAFPRGQASTRMKVPLDLPGADAPPIEVPPFRSDDPGHQSDREAVLKKLYFPLPSISGSPPNPATAGEPEDLAGLQALALANNPSIGVAAAEVESARGLAIQAGTCPNPEIGYEADTINTANSAGYHGAFVQQTIVTGGKLGLARSAAEVDWINARLALQRARIEVATAVRSAYFKALVAREKLRIQTSLAAFTEEVFRTQIELVKAGEAAAYEPLQLRVLVIQSRAAVVQAEQQSAAARRELAVALGLPQHPLGELIGSPEMPLPAIPFDAAQALMLANHTDLTISRNKIAQAQRLLQLARVTPCPNIDTYVAVQHDYTTNPGATTVNVQVGGPLALFNRNKGNIISAQAKLCEAERSVSQVENQLIAQLADAYSRYESNRRLAQNFQPVALRDQVQTYRGIYERRRDDSEGTQFGDVIVAQQSLSALLVQYLTVLGDQWQAVVDIAEILQVDDIYQLGEILPTS